MSGKLFVKTHGCQMNEYDSDKMADLLAETHGLELTDNEAEADVILVNTCSLREKAQEKVFSQLGRWKQHKDGDRAVIIGVGQSFATTFPRDFVILLPFVSRISPWNNTVLNGTSAEQVVSFDCTERARRVEFVKVETFPHRALAEQQAQAADAREISPPPTIRP